MSKTTDQIRKGWIKQWRNDAEADDAAWLRDVLEQPDASTSELVEGQALLFEHIPVDEPEDDWDPNALLHWQEYGADTDDEWLVIVKLYGQRNAVLISEPDSLDRLPFDQLLDDLSTERIVIENNDDDMETLIDAECLIESALDLQPAANGLGSETALPWNGDSTSVEVDLSSNMAKEARSTSII